jgi:hypothetical protein
MRTQLTKESIAAQPIHDAELILLKVTRRERNEVSLSIAAKLHEDEDVDVLFNLGIKTRSFCLKFENILQVVSSMLVAADGKETIDGWRIVDHSEWVDRLVAVGFAQSRELIHYRIDFSSGSSIDVVAEGVSVEEATVAQK